MAKATKFPDGTQEKMEKLLRTSLTGAELRRVQSVLLGTQKISSLQIHKIVGYSPEYIRVIWREYRKKGDEYLLGERRGNGRGKANLSTEEEKKFLEPFIETAKSSGMLIVSDVHKALVTKLGREKLHHSVTYNLLHRHDWRKIVPRPQHPKTKIEAQEAFKASFSPEDRRSKKRGKAKKS
jgi:transposase